MAYRRIPHEKRLNALLECIEAKNIKEAAKKYKISETTIISDYKDLLLEADTMLKKRSLVGRLRIKLEKFLKR